MLKINRNVFMCPENPKFIYFRSHLASITYLPFYGGAKGQYLALTKDKDGEVIKEAIVPEEQVKNISNSINPNCENELDINRDIFEKNLQSVHASAQRILALQQIAKKTGNLSVSDVELLNAELNALSQSAGKLSSLSASGGYDLSAILGTKKNEKKEEQKFEDEKKEEHKFEENVGEEGVGIESLTDTTPELGNSSIAEAKPVGLAIAGEGGLASSKPVATAVVATGGIAVARPVATAIAGVDPTALGVGIHSYGKI